MGRFYKDQNSHNIFQELISLSESASVPSLEEIKANTTDAAQEKHVPVVTIKDNVVEVSVGSVTHPMLDEHYITGIYIGFIYGVLVTYLMAIVMDRILYGIDEGKMTFIVTEHGEEVSKHIDAYSGRGSTILRGMGSYSKQEKDVVMCACNNKQMYTIKKMVHKIDPQAFTIIMESNEVVGEGFKEESGLD